MKDMSSQFENSSDGRVGIELNSIVNERFDAQEFDTEALKVFNMSDAEVEQGLGERNANNLYNSVRKIKRDLQLPSQPVHLRLVEDGEVQCEELQVEKVRNEEVQDKEKRGAYNELHYTTDRMIAGWCVSLKSMFENWMLGFKQHSLAFSAVAVFGVSILWFSLFNMDTIEGGKKNNSNISGFSSLHSSTTTSTLNEGSGAESTSKSLSETYPLDRQSDDVFPVQGVPDNLLPVWHPVFDEGTTTIAVNSCVECHADVFSSATQLL